MDDKWQQQNEQYLVGAIAWLKQKLNQRATTEADTSRPLITDDVLVVDKDSDFIPALVLLSQQFGLSTFDQQLLLLCAALELDTEIAALCAKAQDHPNRPYPTFALALTLFDQPDWSVVLADEPLRYWQLIEVTLHPTTPLTVSALRADMRVVNYLKGVNRLDERLANLISPMQTKSSSELPPSQQATVDEIIVALTRAGRSSGPYPVIQLLSCADSIGQRQLAEATATQLGLRLYRLPIAQLPTQMNELALLARLWQRETLLLPVAIYLDEIEADIAEISGTVTTALSYFVSHCQGICFLSSSDKKTALDRITYAVDVVKPTRIEQRMVWQTLIGSESEETAVLLSGQFSLREADIVEIGESRDKVERSELWAACLEKTRPALDKLAQRVEVKATWDDLVLPESEIALLRQMTQQIQQRGLVYDDWGFRQKMNRGLGVSALFSGKSGTGKTMAAEVIANALNLHLYRIDLSAVISKYIGETEKNLSKLFDAAESGGAILFFDEADALFGQRGEVTDGRDRYANVEINYLLQRIEAFQGLAILATNRRNALDEAFLRRLRFVVAFPFPERAERLRLWQKAFPKEMPVEDIDYQRLAEFYLTGGNIHTITVNAAFLAATEKSAVGMEHVLIAAKEEYRKLDKPINAEDFLYD